MTHEEAEATGRLCPNNLAVRCAASKCMAWRWAQKPNPDWKPGHGVVMSYPPPDMRFDEPSHIDDTTRGYCGLGGRP